MCMLSKKTAILRRKIYLIIGKKFYNLTLKNYIISVLFKYGRSNRSRSSISEIGDEVMVNFINSDLSRPYVPGSMFPKSFARDLKSIITRSGHTIRLNDADDTLSITIKDKNRNVIHLDSKGKNIEISLYRNIIF
jgi:hypothetical protein